MRISIVTDAWHPQINGVVRTLSKITELLKRRGHAVQVITSNGRPTFGLPTYPEIRLAIVASRSVGDEIAAFAPDAVHIATEGTLGLAARRFCLRRGLPFTTGYHTRFPEMIRMRWPLPGLETLAHSWFRWFHGPAERILVPTPSMARVLTAKGFDNVVVWTRGVDHELFRPTPDKVFTDLPRPIALSAGRVAIEKGLPDFLDLDLPGSKVVVGDGPMLDELRARYPNVHFTGYLEGERLARAMASADVFVFPSRTDTFGLVMIEALASGVPVAAFDVPGPKDIIIGDVGMTGDELGVSIMSALDCNPKRCRAYALTFSWERAALQFENYLVPMDPVQRRDLSRKSSARPRKTRPAAPMLTGPD